MKGSIKSLNAQSFRPTRLLLVGLLFLAQMSIPLPNTNSVIGQNKKQSQNDIRDLALDHGRQTFAKARQMLIDYGVAFEPNDLLDPKKRKGAITNLNQMSEFQTAERTGNHLRGVKIADTVYLPEQVKLDGDTVIIARYLIFEGTTVEIKGNHDLHMIPLIEVGLLGTTLDQALFRKNPSLITISEKNPEPSSFSVNRLPLINGGNIRIDLHGYGRAEWLKEKEQRLTTDRGKEQTIFAPVRYEIASFLKLIQTQGTRGSDGQPGGQGTTGTGGTGGISGNSGTCSAGSTNGTGGGSGTGGGMGGTGTNGGNAGNGTSGNSYTLIIPDSNSSMSYTINTYGGDGGVGGAGGTGGTGGQGGTGGTGGTGATCPCKTGQGNGGSGGSGGNGGDGGTGGIGGRGGNGGNGGNIYVETPYYYHGQITPHAEGGSGNQGGLSGTGGAPGNLGDGGQGGNEGTNLSCTPISGTHGSHGANGIFGGYGAGGSPGDAGIGGRPGTFTQTSRDPTYCEIFGEGWFIGIDGRTCVPPECASCYAQGGTDCPPCWTPILIDLGGDQFHMTDAANGVDFRPAPNRNLIRTSWTAASSDDAWLVLDRNGNGVVDDGSELFSCSAPQPDPPRGTLKNGFLALAVFDRPENGGNGDGKITGADSVFSRLRLWQDVNHNGVSESDELKSLDEFEIVRIDLDYKQSKHQDPYGNVFRYRVKVYRGTGTLVGRWAYDVFPRVQF